MFVAHRGGAALAPENTMAAFEPAVRRWDADMLELDVQPTRDGVAVVFHDRTVDRTTDGTGPVRAFSLAELQALDAGAGFQDLDGTPSFRERGVRVPTLDEVLGAFPHLRINVEIKVRAAARPVREVIRRHAAERRVLVAAEHERARWPVRGYPGPWGASALHLFSFWISHRLPVVPTRAPSADVLQVPDVWKGRPVVTEALVQEAHALNLPVHVWVVDVEARMHELLDLGVDAIQTDRPDVLDRVFRARGLR